MKPYLSCGVLGIYIIFLHFVRVFHNQESFISFIFSPDALSLLYNVEALSAFTSDKQQVANTCVPDQYIAETQTGSIE